MNNISITPVNTDHASCCVCLARNYQKEQNSSHDPDFVQDLYDLKIGNQTLRLCPHCLRLIQAQVGQQLIHRNLPEVYAIATNPFFPPKIVKGKKEILQDGCIRVITQTTALTEDAYLFSAKKASDFVFDNLKDAQARLDRLHNEGV